MKTAHIYILKEPESGDVRYVGKTNNPAQRLRLHMMATKRLHSASWIKSLKERGVRPVMEILEFHPLKPAAIWQEAERFYINYFRFLGFRLTNHIAGGYGSYEMTDESKLKCSLAKKGKRFTEEHKAKLRASHWLKNGGKFSQATIEKMRANGTGRKHKPESIAKMWEGRRREAAKRAATLPRQARSD